MNSNRSSRPVRLSGWFVLLWLGGWLPAQATPEVVVWGPAGSAPDPAIHGPALQKALTNVVALAADDHRFLALTAGGKVVSWDRFETPALPASLGDVVAIASGRYHFVGLQASGRVVCWGDNDPDKITPPAGLSGVVAIAAGYYHSLALTTEGRVIAWGSAFGGPFTLPSGLSNVLAIAAGGAHSMALTSEGRVRVWGLAPDDDVAVPPDLTNVVAIACGDSHFLALTAAGGVIGWGHLFDGTAQVPLRVPPGLGHVIAIAAKANHCLALNTEGRVTAWGRNESGQTLVPATLNNAVAIAAGDSSGLAIRGEPPGTALPARVGPRWLLATKDRPFHHRVMVRNGAMGFGAVGLPAGLTMDPTSGVIHGVPSETGTNVVSLAVTNSLGSASWSVTLFVNGPVSPAMSSRGTEIVLRGQPYRYQIVADNEPTEYAATGLPSGWDVDARSGLISGTTSEFGDFPARLVASNPYGAGSAEVTFRISPVVVWDRQGLVWVPGGLEDAVALSLARSVALLGSGQVVGWDPRRGGAATNVFVEGNAVAIATGFSHTLALTADGRVLGEGGYMSDGMTFVAMPVPAGLGKVAAIAAGGAFNPAFGESHSLALTVEGRVVGWGGNTFGQATPPGGLGNVVAIAAGAFHSLALTGDGRVVAWGAGNPGTPAFFDYGQTRVPAGLGRVVAIAASGNASLALTANGRVVGWGDNDAGLLRVPVNLSNVVAIAMGETHALALTADDRLVTWGSFEQGGIPRGLSNVVAIAAGSWYHPYNAVILGRPPGTAPPAWAGPRVLVATAGEPLQQRIVARNGATHFKVTGLPEGLSLDPATGWITGRPAVRGTYPMVVEATNSVGSASWSMTLHVNGAAGPILPLPRLVTAGLGSHFEFPVGATEGPEWHGAEGLPEGWTIDAKSGVISGVPLVPGDFTVNLVATNRLGRGTGSITFRVSPVVSWGRLETAPPPKPALVPAGLDRVAAIASGYYFDLAMDDQGRAFAWGKTDGTTGTAPVPVLRRKGELVAIAAGDFHALGLTADGKVTSWGNNEWGQTNVPSGLVGVVDISAGLLHSLALTVAGRVVAWGETYEGFGRVPAGLGNVVAIASGGANNVVLTASRNVLEWGMDTAGRLQSPIGAQHAVAVVAGERHRLALTPDGHVLAWGWNGEGQCAVPADLDDVVAIAAGAGHSVALRRDGSVVAWGANSEGQCSIPSGLNHVLAIAARGYSSLALVGPTWVSRLRANRVAGRPILRWTSGALEGSNDPGGPWQEIPGARSPWQESPMDGARFFRIRR